MIDTTKLFISILRAKLTGNKRDLSTQDITDSLAELYEISARQGLTNIVGEYLSDEKILGEDAISKKFVNSLVKSLYKTEQMKYDLSVIADVFEENGISYIPLKGSVLRNYYPKDYLRTSADIDILIHEENVSCAISLLSDKSFSFRERTYHDVSIVTPQRNHLELHFNLLETKDNLDSILQYAWDYAIEDKGCKYCFRDDFFLFHFFAHMIYHFTTTGCGIRFLCDLWIIENKMGIKIDTAKELLEKAGIYKFAKEMFNLSHSCFDGGSHSEMTDLLLEFMLSGGTIGKAENRAVLSASQTTQNSVLYSLKRLFPRYKVMKETYPVLRKLPILLPIMWIYRIVYKTKNGMVTSAFKEIKNVNSVSEQDVKRVKKIVEYLDLHT